MRYLILSLILTCSVPASAVASTFWQPRPLSPVAREGRSIVPVRALGFALDTTGMREYLAGAGKGTVQDLSAASSSIELPLPNGTFQHFLMLETPLMPPAMAYRYPYIRTYSGVAVHDPSVTVKFDLTPAGLHAMVLGLPEGDAFIDPVRRGNSILHQAYWKHDLRPFTGRSREACTYDEVNDVPHAMAQTAQWVAEAGGDRTGDCQFRTYRLALACTGEYANFFGATGTNKAPAIAAMATTLHRVNGIYERDAALTMVLVDGDDQLVFTDPDNDGYTNNDGGTMLGENQYICDNVIGSSNYDIGHVFSTGGGGVAYLNSPCTGYKAGGVTGLSSPVGDPFDVDYVAHEMGHQYGGNHTQNNDCNRAGPAAVEVGSGITIMGYAGVCSPNVEPHSIAMFGGYSLQEIHANITSGNSSGCPQTVPLVNTAPTVSAGADRTIPGGTPFVLTATASDPDPGDTLTYSWEQMDAQPSPQPPEASSNHGPNFRPWLPSVSPQRWFPRLAALTAPAPPTPNWEVLADLSRTYHFRVTVRDNAVGGGCNAQDNMTVTVAGGSGPFLVTQPNTALSWPAMSAQTVTWDPAGTAGQPVNCANVDVLLSTDGGATYPYTLASATPNDGSVAVTLPNVATANARMMVRASANIFFDISDQDFTITAPEQVLVSARAWLQGPYAGGIMADQLRASGLVPTGEPYSAMGYAQAGNGGGESCSPAVLAATGPDAVVDWIRLELRSAGNAVQLVCSRQALLQRDGDIVDVDGAQPVAFSVPPGDYYVVLRHRNHLGCMTAATVPLNGTATGLDFTSPGLATYGNEARKAEGNERLLWAGNARADAMVKYTGAENDRDPILIRIAVVDPTATVAGYYPEDCTMDGIVRYTGPANDRDPVLQVIGGTLPTGTRTEQLP